jgi:hypothetical protein
MAHRSTSEQSSCNIVDNILNEDDADEGPEENEASSLFSQSLVVNQTTSGTQGPVLSGEAPPVHGLTPLSKVSTSSGGSRRPISRYPASRSHTSSNQVLTRTIRKAPLPTQSPQRRPDGRPPGSFEHRLAYLFGGKVQSSSRPQYQSIHRRLVNVALDLVERTSPAAVLDKRQCEESDLRRLQDFRKMFAPLPVDAGSLWRFFSVHPSDELPLLHEELRQAKLEVDRLRYIMANPAVSPSPSSTPSSRATPVSGMYM